VRSFRKEPGRNHEQYQFRRALAFLGPVRAQHPPHHCGVPLRAIRNNEALRVSRGRDAGRRHSVEGLAPLTAFARQNQ
jgi:hypothetical protein